MSTATTLGRQVWPPRITALLLAGLLGASGVYWGIKLFGQSRDSSAAQIPVALFDAHATQMAGTSDNGANAAAAPAAPAAAR